MAEQPLLRSKLIPRPEPSTYFRDIGIRAVAAAVIEECSVFFIVSLSCSTKDLLHFGSMPQVSFHAGAARQNWVRIPARERKIAWIAKKRTER